MYSKLQDKVKKDMSFNATDNIIKEVIDKLDYPKKSEEASSCPLVLRAAAAFGKPEKDDLTNAGVAAEFFYKALYDHYWLGKGEGADVILGDYYGSIGIIYAAKIRDKHVLEKFCGAIQNATNEEDGDYKSAGRLAKIYGASAYVGAYIAGVGGSVLDDFYKLGEKTGLKLLGAVASDDWHEIISGIDSGKDFVSNLDSAK